jgi:hypothetical protein
MGETVPDGIAIAGILRDNVYSNVMTAGVPGDEDTVTDAEGNKVGVWRFTA